MKEQLFITIILLSTFCVFVILFICCSVSYEFLKEDYNQKKNIF